MHQVRLMFSRDVSHDAVGLTVFEIKFCSPNCSMRRMYDAKSSTLLFFSQCVPDDLNVTFAAPSHITSEPAQIFRDRTAYLTVRFRLAT